MRQIDVPLQVDRLLSLANRFAGLHDRLAGYQPAVGTEALRGLSDQIIDAHTLVAEALVRLLVLDDSQVTQVPGSRSTLERLASMVEHAAAAAAELAAAVAANAYDAAPWPTPRRHKGPTRQRRHDDARTRVTAHVDEAAHRLKGCEHACRDVAAFLAETALPALRPTAATEQATRPAAPPGPPAHPPQQSAHRR